MLIDSVCELNIKKISLEEKVKNQDLELISLTLQMSQIEEMVTKLNSENLKCMGHWKR